MSGKYLPERHDPVARLERIYSFLLPRDRVGIIVMLDDQRIEMRETSEPAPHQSYTAPSPIPATTGEGRTLPLVKPAWGRSGDKDGLCNVGVIARHKEYPPYIRSALTGSAFLDWMRHTYDEPENGQARRYDV